MKISVRSLFLCAIAATLALTPAVFAQDNKPSAPAEPAADKAAAQPAAPGKPATPVAPAIEEPAAPAATPLPAEPAVSADAATESSSKDETAAPSKLRRLDNDDDEDSVAPKTPAGRHQHRSAVHAAVRANRTNRDIVNVFSDSVLEKGDKVDNVVAVFGSSLADGEVTDSVVSVLGSNRATGPVGDAVVAVLGDSEVTGTVGDSAVAVLGNLSINSHVKGDVVAVLGDVKFGPNAEVDGDVVCVGGTVTKAVGTNLHHTPQRVGFHFMHGGDGLKAWVHQCFLYGRPLAFGPDLMWAWWIALACLAFYVVLALIFGKGINKCVETFELRPGYSILAALLTVLLGPVVIIVLAITGVGIFVIPFLAAALFFASLFGKAVMLAWIGRRVGKSLGAEHPALAVLIGGVLVLFLYTIWGSFILYKLIDWVGLGVVVYTLIGAMKRERPVVPPVVPPVAPIFVAPMDASPVSSVPLAATESVTSSAAVSGDPLAAAAAATVGAVPVPPVVSVPAVPVNVIPPLLPAATLPRAGFWIRTAALLLDVILVAIVCSFFSGLSFGRHVKVDADLLPALALYGAVMWKLRGTTVGGIVCGLKVIRLDDRPIDWGTAIVRALSCFLSLFVMGLGFIWVVFDDQRQSWHDKIAGTTVVRVPKGASLV